MKRVSLNGLKVWQFESLSAQDRIRHYVSERNSADNEREYTLSLSSVPDKEFVLQNREMLAHALQVSPSRMFFPSQVHETRIVNVGSDTSKSEILNTDALICNERGICISVMSADCVPILLYDKTNSAVAAVHSGWRGTVAKILEKTLNQMRCVFGTKGADLIAGIGPSVCQESYEVGEEVIKEVCDAFGSGSDLLIARSTPGKANLDLWKANKLQLLDFGVSESSIEISDLCTVKNNEHFFSARKGDKGRFAAGIMLI